MNDHTCEQELYSEIYRSSKMGTESILTLLSKVDNDSLRHDMTAQMNGYGSFTERAERGLTRCNAKAKEEKKTKVIAAKTGIAAETMFDTSPSNIAELMIRGSGADIISITRAQNEATHGQCRIPVTNEAYALSEEMITFENQNIERMKKYL